MRRVVSVWFPTLAETDRIRRLKVRAPLNPLSNPGPNGMPCGLGQRPTCLSPRNRVTVP